MPKQNTYPIEFTGGGPLDGRDQVFQLLPTNGDEITFNAHSYTFDISEWKFRYQGRWRQISMGYSWLSYRTYEEASRQLSQLRAVGAISSTERLQYQAQVINDLFAHGNMTSRKSTKAG